MHLVYSRFVDTFASPTKVMHILFVFENAMFTTTVVYQILKAVCGLENSNFFFPRISLTLIACNRHTFFLIFGGHKSFSWGHWYPFFGLLAMSPLGFKARVDPSLVCFVACVQWIPEIHLWCDTCWLYRGQHGSWAFSIHVPADASTSIVVIDILAIWLFHLCWLE